MAGVLVDLATGALTGAPVDNLVRTMGDMVNVYRDEAARALIDPSARVYEVQTYLPVRDGTAGGLFWGATLLEPGRVGDEYFMTKGHFHALRDRGEYYVTVSGTGGLILMDEDRRACWEPMTPGSVHYIPANVAHRVANTGTGVLSFLACWPSDAGHDYETIAAHGFSARLRDLDGVPTLIEES